MPSGDECMFFFVCFLNVKKILMVFLRLPEILGTNTCPDFVIFSSKMGTIHIFFNLRCVTLRHGKGLVPKTPGSAPVKHFLLTLH